MEEKQKFPTATGFSGKILIASLFILSGILLFARNMGWSLRYDRILAFTPYYIRYIFYDSPPFHRWNHPFVDRFVFFDWRAFMVARKFAGNGMAYRSDNSRCLILF